jgi:hypothetical protein
MGESQKGECFRLSFATPYPSFDRKNGQIPIGVSCLDVVPV